MQEVSAVVPSLEERRQCTQSDSKNARSLGKVSCKIAVRSSMSLDSFTLENHRDFDGGFSDLQQRGMHALAAFSS